MTASATGDDATTGRPVVPNLEAILGREYPVLDHGFIRVVDYMGDDAAVVQAARVSYGARTRRVREDRGLIRYLMRHRHTTPFEMCSIKFHVKLPIFVARQWIRHRTASVNEYSARYSVLDREFYLPAPEDLAVQSKSNAQGREESVSPDVADEIRRLLEQDARQAYSRYEWLLNEQPDGSPVDPDRPGLARELARINLPLSTYTQWYWKVNLHNLLHFLLLRADPHAQTEIRVYAEAMLGIVRRWVPVVAEAFEDYRLGAAELSGPMLTVVRAWLAGEQVDREASGLGIREWRELHTLLGLELPET
ncbi:MAG: FAD-dependent thymidylate synthase [Rhodospirillales bacterium]|nr:FAD-dependent thymidylate synthase [Rhodospirillales bacterium]